MYECHISNQNETGNRRNEKLLCHHKTQSPELHVNRHRVKHRLSHRRFTEPAVEAHLSGGKSALSESHLRCRTENRKSTCCADK